MNTRLDLAARKSWKILKEVANKRVTITYSELSDRVDYPVRSISKVLEVLQNHCLENALPPITSTVINKKTDTPGKGYIIRYGSIEVDQKVNSSFNWNDLDYTLEYSYNVDYEVKRQNKNSDNNVLSIKDRLIISNQFDILSKLTRVDYEREWYMKQYEIIRNGYELLYSDLFDTIYDPMSKQECTFVIDIIEVYSCITRTVQENLTDDVIKKYNLKLVKGKYLYSFPGFDHNDNVQVRYSAYAKFFMFKLDRFTEIHEEKSDYNSHGFISINKYNSMISEWKKSINKYSLSLDDVERIVNS